MNQMRIDGPPEVLYEDSWYLIVLKEKEELTVPGRGPGKEDCLMSRAVRSFGEVYNIHRLDQPTSGLVIIARSKEAQMKMSSLFENRLVNKEYTARVRGIVIDEVGVIDLPMRADWENRPRQIIDPEKGKRAVTRWKVLKRSDLWTDMRLYPETGRTHQLRVHMKAIGHPILGDRLYNDDVSDDAMGELRLHASKLSFEHPFTGEPIAVESEERKMTPQSR